MTTAQNLNLDTHINPEYVPEPEKVNVKKGLEGVVIDTTKVSKVNPETNSLIYRGYPVQELAENCSFEEVAFLLYYAELPNSDQLESFKNRERQYRDVSQTVLKAIEAFPKETHPMDAIRTAVSILGCEDTHKINGSQEEYNLDRAIQLLAKIPTLIAAHYRLRKGQKVIAPRKDFSIAENFFYMCFDKVPQKKL